ncbi:MAG: glycosyltransferase family 8 protein [Burkholderiales bacterium]
MAERLTVITLADENYAVPLAVMGRSLFDNLGHGRFASLTIIDGGLTPRTKERLLASWNLKQGSVEFVAPCFGGATALPVWGRMTPLTYTRIFTPAYVPANCAKAIFLDSDLLILQDLGRLWDVPAKDTHVLAVQDPAVPFVSSCDGLARYEALRIAPETPYFNAGLMVVNVEKWRSDDIPAAALRFIEAHAHELNYCDQDALNAVLIGKWRALDPRWQVQPRFAGSRQMPLPHLAPDARLALVADPWVYHFSGRLKPWAYSGNGAADRLFFEYLDRTGWKGWRPQAGPKGVFLRLYDSRLRGWWYPLEQRALAWLRSRRRRMVSVSDGTAPIATTKGPNERGLADRTTNRS